MKKALKITAIAAGALLIAAAAATIFAPSVARRYIERHGKELVGREIRMDKLKFNPFSGNLAVEGFRLFEIGDTTEFIRFDTLKVRIKLLPLLRNKVIIKRILLTDADIRIDQDGSRFNFDDIVARFSSTEDSEAANSPSWEIGLYDIALRRTDIIYSDRQVGGRWELLGLTLDIPEVYFSDRSTDVGFDLSFGSGGSLATEMAYNIESSEYDISLRLKDFRIDGLLPYLQQSVDISSLTGRLTAGLNVTGDVNHIMEFVLRGEASLDGLNLEDRNAQDILSAEHITLGVKECSLHRSLFDLDSLLIDGMRTRFTLEADGSNNYAAIMRTDTAAAEAAEDAADTPVILKIGHLNVRNGSVTIEDRTLPETFRYAVNRIGVKADGFDLAAANDMRLTADVGRSGKASIRWRGSLDDISNQNISINLNNVDLTEFSPYSLHYLAYPISNGNFTIISQNVIADNRLTGTNHLDVYRCEVEKQRKDLEPQYRVPLRLALYVLKDRNDKIDISLPVSGDISSPEFSYRKIIFKTLGNLLVKVVASPFSFLSGSGKNKLSTIEISPTQLDFTTDQYSKIAQIADAMISKPELKLEMVQRINYTEAYRQQALFDLKRDYYRSLHPEAGGSIDLLDFEAIDAIDSHSDELEQFAEQRLAADSLTAGGDIYAKADALYHPAVSEQVARMCQRRNRQLSEALLRSGVPQTSFSIVTELYDPQQKYSGRSRYNSTFTMEGEDTSEIESEFDSEEADNGDAAADGGKPAGSGNPEAA